MSNTWPVWLFAAKHAIDVPQFKKDFWKKMALACRYGHISINEAMAMPSRDLHLFIESVISLIGEENTVHKD